MYRLNVSQNRAIAGVLIVLLLVSAADATGVWFGHDLGTLGGRDSYATAVNDSGSVVGYGYTPSFAIRSYIWSPPGPPTSSGTSGGFKDIGTLGGYTEARAINAHGVVVGLSQAGTPVGNKLRAFRWTAQTGIENLGILGTDPEEVSKAYGVNDAGDIVGLVDMSSTASGGGERAFLWRAGVGMTGLDTSVAGADSVAADINNLGQVVGSCGTGQGGWRHACFWTPGIPAADLGTLGGRGSAAFAINDLGQVAGYSETATPGMWHAFIWTVAGGMVDLGHLGGDFSYAYGIGETGEAVGASATVIGGPSQPFYWSESTGMQDLGTLGGYYGAAYGINAAGQIVGDSFTADLGGQAVRHAVLWAARPMIPILAEPNRRGPRRHRCSGPIGATRASHGRATLLPGC